MSDNKTVSVNVRFWTDDIAPVKGDIIPKHTWDRGTVEVVVNDRHGIRSAESVPFHGMYDLERATRKALRAAEIIQHIG